MTETCFPPAPTNVELIKGGASWTVRYCYCRSAGIADLVAYCLAYEFEDTFAAVTAAQRIDATDLPGSGILSARLQARTPSIRVTQPCAPACALPAEQGDPGSRF